MKISKKLVIKIALRVLDEREQVTQFDIHTAIEEYLTRQLSVGEKLRVTRIVMEEFTVVEMRRERREKIRVYYFRR